MQETIDRRVWIAIAAVVLLVLGLIVFAAVRNGNETPARPDVTVTQTVVTAGASAKTPGATGTAADTGPTGPTGIGTRVPAPTDGGAQPTMGQALYPLNRAAAERLVRQFVPAFTQLNTTLSDPTLRWMRQIEPFSTYWFLRSSRNNYRNVWGRIEMQKLAAIDSRILSIQIVENKQTHMRFRVTIERKLFPGEGSLDQARPDRLSLDVWVLGQAPGDPRVGAAVDPAFNAPGRTITGGPDENHPDGERRT